MLNKISSKDQASLLTKMSSRGESDGESEMKGSMWVLDQKLDQPMDEEAGRLNNMYKEKVPTEASIDPC